MRFTEHTAMKAAEQMQAGVVPDDIDPTELSSLAAYIAQLPPETLDWISNQCRVELQDREYRNPDQTFFDYVQQQLCESVGIPYENL